jgi:hypothetical protein
VNEKVYNTTILAILLGEMNIGIFKKPKLPK